jgi:hypothetical protein
MAEKLEVKKLVAFAPFEFGGKQYKIGDTFTAPAGLLRDFEFEKFRNMSTLKGEIGGMAFSQTLPPMTLKGDPTTQRMILPLKEA